MKSCLQILNFISHICITEINEWMTHNCLKLKNQKLIVKGDAISKTVTLTVGKHNIKQSTLIRSLGVKLDSEITIEPYTADVCKSVYYHLGRIIKYRKYLTEDSTKTLIHSLGTDRVDYCNSLYQSKAIHGLQLIHNFTTRVITKANRHNHITPMLHKLHWLFISIQAAFKRRVLTFKWPHRSGPGYVSSPKLVCHHTYM